MSLPDYLLDDPDDVDECQACGCAIDGKSSFLCRDCVISNADMYADMAIQDNKEGL
jgi:hypothetical protein